MINLLMVPVLSRGFAVHSVCAVSLSVAVLKCTLVFLFNPILGVTVTLSVYCVLTSINVDSVFISRAMFLTSVISCNRCGGNSQDRDVAFSVGNFLRGVTCAVRAIVLFNNLNVFNCGRRVGSNIVGGTAGGTVNAVTFKVPPVLVVVSVVIFHDGFGVRNRLTRGVRDCVARGETTSNSRG